jgi:hypothetical protein
MKNYYKWTILMGLFLVLILGLFYFKEIQTPKTQAATHDVSLSTSVQEYLYFDITAGDTVNFGNLTPGNPIAAPATGTIASVTTNAANGYTIGLHDGIAGSDSCLLHTDTTTRIADYAGTIATPTTWTGTGLGITLYAADNNKESKWGTGTTYNDVNNKYAGIPQSSTVAHTVTGYHSGADTSSWAFKIDVPNTQKTGSYSGTMTFTATAVLS